MCSSNFEYTKVPCMKVVSLKFTRDNSKVYFKISCADENYTMVNIGKKRTLNDSEVFPVPKIRKEKKAVSKEKKNDLKDMLKFMPAQDKAWYQVTMSI